MPFVGDGDNAAQEKMTTPFLERKLPEIFMRNFITRMSCSARLLVKGTIKSRAKRSTSVLKSRIRRARAAFRLAGFALSCQWRQGFVRFKRFA